MSAALPDYRCPKCNSLDTEIRMLDYDSLELDVDNIILQVHCHCFDCDHTWEPYFRYELVDDDVGKNIYKEED